MWRVRKMSRHRRMEPRSTLITTAPEDSTRNDLHGRRDGRHVALIALDRQVHDTSEHGPERREFFLGHVGPFEAEQQKLANALDPLHSSGVRLSSLSSLSLSLSSRDSPPSPSRESATPAESARRDRRRDFPS